VDALGRPQHALPRVLNAGQTAQLASFKQNATNQWLQTLYNQGVQDPTKDARWPQIQAQIDIARRQPGFSLKRFSSRPTQSQQT